MSNQSYQSRKNILKGIGVLCFLSIFGYYSYQDSMNKIMLEKSLNENAARQRAFRNKFHDSHSSPSENGNITYKKNIGRNISPIPRKTKRKRHLQRKFR